MIKHADSHLDHGLTTKQIDFIFAKLGERDSFFIETIELPAELGTVSCALHGPIMGDEPIGEPDVVRLPRGDRAWRSRMAPKLNARRTNLVTVIAGPHGDYPCVLYTAFGGPLAPQEPEDPSCKDVVQSTLFWDRHALAMLGPL